MRNQINPRSSRTYSPGLCIIILICILYLPAHAFCQQSQQRLGPSSGIPVLFDINPHDFKVTLNGLRQDPTGVFITTGSSYRIVISRPGYSKQVFKLQASSEDSVITISTTLLEKSRVRAGLLSLLYPGLGQFYESRGGAGFLYFAGEAGAIAASAILLSRYKEADKEYKKALDDYLGAPGHSDVLEARVVEVKDKRDTIGKQSGLFILTGAAIWAWSFLDALLFMPRARENRTDNINIGFRANHNGRLMLVFSRSIW